MQSVVVFAVARVFDVVRVSHMPQAAPLVQAALRLALVVHKAAYSKATQLAVGNPARSGRESALAAGGAGGGEQVGGYNERAQAHLMRAKQLRQQAFGQSAAV